MSGRRHRLALYFGLRQDPDLETRAPAEQPNAWVKAIRFALGMVVLLTPFVILVAAIRLVAGHSADPGTVVWGGLRLLLGVFGVAALATGIAAWIRWFAARRQQWLRRRQRQPR